MKSTKEIIKMIEELKKQEQKCMDKDKYKEQELEHINQIEMADKIISKLRGQEE